MTTFAERIKENTQRLKEIEVKKLKPFLRKHFDIIENFIEEHKQVNISFAKQKGELANIESKVYESLAKDLMETDFKEYTGYIITADNLAKYISQIRIEKDCKKQNRKSKNIEIVNPIVENNEEIKLPQKTDAELPSVEVLQSHKPKEGNSTKKIDNVSSEQVHSKDSILTEDEEKIVLNSMNEHTYFKYKKFIDKLDQGVITDKSYGIHEDEINMEKLVKVIYKMFEMEFPGTDIGILADGQKRGVKIENSKLNPAIKKMASQLWARNDLINMLIGRKNRQS